MPMNNARLFAPIEKTEVQDDGTIKVWGYASAPTEDSDGEIITAGAMKAALPDYLKFGAVREMHGKSAAGTAIEAEVQDDGRTWFGAHVVDPIAVKKVQSKVYKGFSIGGRVTSRDDVVKTTITGLKLVEVSLVDRPANPDAVFTVFKADAEVSAVDELAKMVTEGVITPEQLVTLAKAAVEAENPAAGDVSPVPTPDDAAKTDGAPAGDPAAPLRKSMYGVSRFAELLNAVASIAADSAYEAQYEGDKSPVPAKLRDWLGDGAAIFAEMAAEETNEMIAGLTAMMPVVVDNVIIEDADAAGDLTKAGARNSKRDATMIQTMHDNAVSLGAGCNSDKAAAGGDLAKFEAVTSERDEAVAKVAALEEEVEKLKKAPAAGKAILKAFGKGEDVATPAVEPEVEKVETGTPALDETATLIKAALRHPVTVTR